MSTVIKRLKQNNQHFVPVTLAEAVVVNTSGITGIQEITTLDKVLQKIGINSSALSQINQALSNLQSSKQNKLTAGYGINIDENNKISVTLSQTLYQVVDQLPEPSVNVINTIYIVPIISQDVQNSCAEYVCLYNKDTQTYYWEQFGTFKTDIGLSGYITENEFYGYAVTAEDMTFSNGKPVGVNYDIPSNLYDDAVI